MFAADEVEEEERLKCGGSIGPGGGDENDDGTGAGPVDAASRDKELEVAAQEALTKTLDTTLKVTRQTKQTPT